MQKDGRRAPAHNQVTLAGQARRTRNPTTSFLTATILIYAIGAGITAAAGRCSIQPSIFCFSLSSLIRVRLYLRLKKFSLTHTFAVVVADHKVLLLYELACGLSLDHMFLLWFHLIFIKRIVI